VVLGCLSAARLGAVACGRVGPLSRPGCRAAGRGPGRARAGARRKQWPALVRELAAQLDAGRVYARDLPDLGTALNELNAAYRRRPLDAAAPDDASRM
jgi:hypothetical protein